VAGSIVEVKICAASEAEIYQRAVSAFGEFASWTKDATPDRMPILLPTMSRQMLLADLLDDLVYLVRFERFAAVHVERLDLDERYLRAAVSGWTGDVISPVKRVVRRQAACEQTENGWRASIMLQLGPTAQSFGSRG
jgi:SHS2 domain-containing protein